MRQLEVEESLIERYEEEKYQMKESNQEDEQKMEQTIDFRTLKACKMIMK